MAIIVTLHYSALYYKVTRTLFWRLIVNSDTSAISSGAKEWLWTLFVCWINFCTGNIYLFNPFHATDLFWYPLKTSENQRFSDVFREYQKKSVSWNGLKSKIEKWKKVWNILKVNNKNTRTRSLTSFWCLYCNFEYISHFFNSFYC